MAASRNRFYKIGVYLKDRRVKSGLSQRDVADMFNLTTVQFVSNWERGLCLPPMHYFSKLCKSLKIDQEMVVTLIMEQKESEVRAALKGRGPRA